MKIQQDKTIHSTLTFGKQDDKHDFSFYKFLLMNIFVIIMITSRKLT